MYVVNQLILIYHLSVRSYAAFFNFAFKFLLQIAFESISNIRTVVSLGLEERFSAKYTDSLSEPYK